MIVVLIHWKIKPEQETVEDFFEFWRTEATVDDRSGLICELLNETPSPEGHSWITWQPPECEGKYRSFINIGYWNSSEEFHEQIGKYFETSMGQQPFEAFPRVRTVLNPKCWRIGDASLPPGDSGGVM